MPQTYCENIADINALFISENWQDALKGYIKYALVYPEFADCIRFNIVKSQQQLRISRGVAPLSVGVFCWNIANNALGRAETLRAIYQRAGIEAVMMGMQPYPTWQKIWPPLSDKLNDVSAFALSDHSQLLSSACEFVLQHPLDLVHISKPRLPGVIVGLLYKLIWSAKVIMDIDDEELAFVGKRAAISLNDLPVPNVPPLDLKHSFWTEIAVGTVAWFDAITVSNPALQKRYGGDIIPHARDKDVFDPNQYDKTLERERLGIALDKKVILFLGTPRAHKGVLETAEALSALGRNDYLFVVVGNFIDPVLKASLLDIPSLNLLLLPDQPYADIARTVVVADLCVLLQDATSLASQFQLPAKLIDALAMGVTVCLEATEATADFVDNKLVVPVNKPSLVQQLSDVFQGITKVPDKRHCREYFERYLSEQAMSRKLAEIVKSLDCSVTAVTGMATLMHTVTTNDTLAFLKCISKCMQIQAIKTSD